MVAIPLPNAALCLDCSNITGSLSHCEVCGSGSMLAISRVLDRELQPMPRYPIIAWPTERRNHA